MTVRELALRVAHPGEAQPPASHASHSVRSYALRVLVATAFGIDAFVHATNASIYDSPHGGLVTEGSLFRAEAAVAGLVALLILVRASRSTWALGLGVAASALGAVVLYRYVDVGAIGPIPDLYEPTWHVPGKLLSAYAEGAAVLVSVVGLASSLNPPLSRRRKSRLSRASLEVPRGQMGH